MSLEPIAAVPARDPRTAVQRLDWSRWLRCQSSFHLALAPQQPGLFVLAEEVLAEGESPLFSQKTGAPGAPGFGALGWKRMLAVFHVEQADDLARALSALFRPGDLRARIDSGRIFVRYATVDDITQRAAALAALQQWLAATAEAASGIADPMVSETRPMHHQEDSPKPAQPPSSLPR